MTPGCPPPKLPFWADFSFLRCTFISFTSGWGLLGLQAAKNTPKGTPKASLLGGATKIAAATAESRAIVVHSGAQGACTSWTSVGCQWSEDFKSAFIVIEAALRTFHRDTRTINASPVLRVMGVRGELLPP